MNDVPITYTDEGTGPAVLLLHGGAGPRSVAAFAQQYAGQHGARVVTPTHPGFDGTPRPAGLDSIAELAQLYAGMLEALDLSDVTVVGNSIGGWIAVELALLAEPRVARQVVVDAVGLELDDAPIVDFFSLSMDEVTELSYRHPDRFRIDVDALPEAQQAMMAANRASLRVYGGDTMADPTLRARLPRAAGPTLVVWGAADRIVPVDHGRVYARELPTARLEIVDDAGHLPQFETPDTLADLIARFMADPKANWPE